MNIPIFIKQGRKRVSIAKEIREVNRLRMGFERSMRSRLYSLFAEFGEKAAAEYQARQSIDDALRPLEGRVSTIFRATYTDVIETFANRVFDSRKLTPFGDLVFSYYQREGADKVRAVSATTKRRILRAINQGEKEALGVDKTAKLIVEKTSGVIGRSRAATIARTETHAAASYATDAATRELNLPNQKKRWVSVSDGRTRTAHAQANGQEVDIDEKFLIRIGGREVNMAYPHDGSGGPANNINCRCIAVYFTDEDALFDDVDNQLEPPPPPPLPPEPTRRRRRRKVPTPPEPTPPEPTVPTPAMIDFSSRIFANAKGKAASEKVKKAFNEWMDSRLNTTQKRVVRKLPKPKQIIVGKGKGVYYGGGSRLETGLELVIPEHEYGHHVDWELSKAKGKGGFWSTTGRFRVAFNEDCEAMGLRTAGQPTVTEDAKKFLNKIRDELFELKTIEKTYQSGWRKGMVTKYKTWQPKDGRDGAGAIADMMDAATKGYFHTDMQVWGHGKSYYNRTDNDKIETFANIFSLLNNKAELEYARKYFPKSIAFIEEALKEFADG